MKNLKLFGVLIILLLIFISACRHPSLEQAIIDYNQNRNDQAYESVKNAVKAIPEDPEAWYYYGEISGKRGNYQEMMDAFDKSLALSPTYKDKINFSKSTYFSKTYNTAVQTYNNYINLEDKESENAKKALNGIIDDFKKSLIIKDDFQASRLISIAFNYLDDEENQIKYMNKATEISPDTSLGWIDLGIFYRNKKDYEKATENFKKALDVEPENINANTMYAEVLDFSGKKEEAKEAYKKAIELNPEEKAIPYNLGLVYYKDAVGEDVNEQQKMEALVEAAIYFEIVYNLDPEFKGIYDIYGLTLIYLKKYETAETLLLEGSKYFPDAASIWTNLSVVYANLGKKDEANEAAKKAKELANE